MTEKQIFFPNLPQSDIITHYAQLRPYRQGGNRLEKTSEFNKIIVHNYGHGGAGVSLAPGSAIKSIKLVQTELNDKKECCIIGCGIIGLLTAYELIQNGFSGKINIYTQKMPSYCNKQNKQMITSEVAPGFWLPYSYGSNNKDLHEELSNLSLQRYINMSDQTLFKTHLQKVDVYDISTGSQIGVLRSKLTTNLLPTVRDISISINKSTKWQCQYFKTVKVNLQPFLFTIKHELIKHKVNFIEKTITKYNIQTLQQHIVFNCSGLGSRELFNDKAMKGVKGHLIEYKNPWPQQFNYILKATIDNKVMMYYMHQNRIIIGRNNSEEQNIQINQHTIKQIKQTHQKIWKMIEDLKNSSKL